jgi:hypothetical protein
VTLACLLQPDGIERPANRVGAADVLSWPRFAHQPRRPAPSRQPLPRGEVPTYLPFTCPFACPIVKGMKGTRSDRGMERLAWILGALIALALFGIIALTFGM